MREPEISTHLAMSYCCVFVIPTWCCRWWIFIARRMMGILEGAWWIWLSSVHGVIDRKILFYRVKRGFSLQYLIFERKKKGGKKESLSICIHQLTGAGDGQRGRTFYWFIVWNRSAEGAREIWSENPLRPFLTKGEKIFRKEESTRKGKKKEADFVR